MQESHGKDLASHPDPESCAGGRKATGEALTGAHAGQPSSREIKKSGMPTPLTEAEGNIVDGTIGEPYTNPARSETLSMRGNSLRRNREIPQVPVADGAAGRPEKVSDRTSGMHACGKSDGCIVPKKLPNKDGHCSSAEAVEGRRPTEGNTLPSAAPRTQCRTGASIGLQRVREAATLLRQAPEVRAVCGSSARTDLRGGPPARAVPTATDRPTLGIVGVEDHCVRSRLPGRAVCGAEMDACEARYYEECHACRSEKGWPPRAGLESPVD